MTAAKKLKEKTCAVKGCENTYIQYDSLRTWCSPECGAVLAMQKLEKKREKDRILAKKLRRAENAKFKKKVRDNDRSWWLKATQADVNRYVRWRDRDQPCCTCNKPPESSDKFVKGSGIDAGHYLTRAAYSALRFDIRQIHAQCVKCNRFNSGRRQEFREFMINKFDLEFVEWLESQTQPKKWTVDELKEIRAHYRKLLRDEQNDASD